MHTNPHPDKLATVIYNFIQTNQYTVVPSNEVRKKQVKKLYQTPKHKLYYKYLRIIKLLKINPYPHHFKTDSNPNPHQFIYDAEHLNPHTINHYSLRLNHQNRVVYTINERYPKIPNGKLVVIYEVVGHYTNHKGIKV